MFTGRFILFHGKRHPQEMNGPEIEAFLTHKDVSTTMNYTHGLERGACGVLSPLDALPEQDAISRTPHRSLWLGHRRLELAKP